ncbi:TIGR02300 family protein [Methylobacterium sp. P1-11]|uniref:TIGR02300 family protein n=1 Tax=Methylobacterium sp. P1-11 TaxID=2024616 RepID=UPI0011F007D6|nr:TIGR02300 family protein [Methylobacterium sp. P1-11]KAA0121504.1 TIGR02300 family protein [Methylobacterium sp. P1-11]
MARPDLGTKRICPTTGKKFYDLNKNPVISPYSGEVVPTAVATSYSTRAAAPVVARKEAPADEEDETEGPELVSLDEVEAEEADKDTDTETESDDALDIDDEDDSVEDDTLVVDEDDDDDTTDLVEVNDDDDE